MACQEFENDPEFMKWLEEYYRNSGGWQSEYSGNIRGLYDAWCAAKEKYQQSESQ